MPLFCFSFVLPNFTFPFIFILCVCVCFSYRVCEYVYEERGELEKIVECYLEDKMRRHQVFTYIRTVLSSPQFTDLHAQKIQDQFVKHIRVSSRLKVL